MKKLTELKLNEVPVLRIILKIVSIIIAMSILLVSSLTISVLGDSETISKAPQYLIWIFMLSALMSVVTFFRNSTVPNLIKSIILVVFNVALGAVVWFANNNPLYFSITAGSYCLNIIFNCVFNMIQEKKIRSYILNSLIIIFAILLAIGLFSTPMLNLEDVQNVIIVECVFIAVVSLVQAMYVAFADLKVKVLFKIMFRTFSLEILFGLLTMMMCFSFVLMNVEPSITNFPDALWYCFAIVTTIGFGDFVAVTPIGRLLSAILGMYGIVVVAVLTSIIVNFYNETNGKSDSKKLEKIAEEEKKKKK